MYLSGYDSNADLQRVRGAGAAGFAVGVIYIDAPFPVYPGNPVNASTFDFPVLYERISGISGAQVISGDPVVERALVEAAQTLEGQGVQAIVGTCGSFVRFQESVVRAVSIPVFSSVMMLCDMILSVLPTHKKLGIIFANKAAFTEDVVRQCGIRQPGRIVVTDCWDHGEFSALSTGGVRFNGRRFEMFFEETVRTFRNENKDLGAIVLQCNELNPYRWIAQSVADIPVFDCVGLIKWLYHALSAMPYSGLVFGVEKI